MEVETGMETEGEQEGAMIRNPHARRSLALLLTVLGGLAIFLAPEGIWVGAMLLAFGVALEVAGSLIQRRRQG